MLFKITEDNNIFNLCKITNDINIINNENCDCFICFEYKKQNETTIKMNSQEVYLKFCSCNICIHVSCLELWFNENGTCPICHELIYINNWHEFTYGFYIIYYLLFLKPYIYSLFNNIKKFKNAFIYLYLLFNFMIFIDAIQNIQNIQKIQK
jgi:hypothetical protein